jgi:hypothetical protein
VQIVSEDGNIIFDQMENADKDLSGRVTSGIGETLVSVDVCVDNDFKIKVFKHVESTFALNDEQVGTTICLHAAFLENNFQRC